MELIKINTSLSEFKFKKPVVACIGEFDGMHMAHQKLIIETIDFAKANDCASALITFDPHPDYVLKKREYEGYLTGFEEKKKFAQKLGLDYFIVIDFNFELAKLNKDEFYERYLKNLKGLFIGSDYKFGYKGEGNEMFLCDKFEFFRSLDVMCYGGLNEKIGSDVIRNSLKEGNVSLANELLGRKFSYSGKVLEGNRLGRTWGFPTANILINKEHFKIKKGVYAVNCEIGDKVYLGIANFGNNPTCNFVEEARLEVHLFDFEEDIYGKKIKVDFIKFVRGEKKFESSIELVEQIKKDIELVKEEFGGKV